jgi:hypothetical protein
MLSFAHHAHVLPAIAALGMSFFAAHAQPQLLDAAPDTTEFPASNADWRSSRLISRADYADRLRALWLGQVVANWTGIRTEGNRQAAPFLTDADWGVPFDGGPPLTYVFSQDPWQADDDTDIEYIWLHLLTQHGEANGNRLTPMQIRDGWATHVNRFIWVSNERARILMGGSAPGRSGPIVLPPGTSLPAANQHWMAIDAQLTTEFFGALCPGMPERALDMSLLPIRTTAGNHAAYASQFFVLLYSLALQADPALPIRDRILSIYTRALAFMPPFQPGTPGVPGTAALNKARDIAEFVLADYLANPDKDNWERTRDLVYQRYQLNASTSGFMYRGWTESSVNFAGGLIALLYGEGDYLKTVRVGALSGWDSDNGTATMGGLLGIMLGYDEIVRQIRVASPNQNLSDRFWARRTRDSLPDFLASDPAAEDSFTLMAERMLVIADREVRAAGGLVDPQNDLWLLPPVVRYGPQGTLPAPFHANPLWREDQCSASWSLRRTPAPNTGTAIATSSVSAIPSSPPSTYGERWPSFFANGVETEFSGRDQFWERSFYSTQNASPPLPPGTPVTLTVTFSRPVEIAGIRFIEGDHFTQTGPGATANGGWFETISAEALVDGQWRLIYASATQGPGSISEPLDPNRAFQTIDFVLPTNQRWNAAAVRISGLPGGPASLGGPFATCAELDGLRPATPAPTFPSFDLSGDGRIDTDDLHQFDALFPAPSLDLDASGTVDDADHDYLEHAARWREFEKMTPPNRE